MIKFSCNIESRGWVKVQLSSDIIDKYITASYLSDALKDFIVAVISIAQGSKYASCNWQEEPGEFRFVFTREGVYLTIKILKFNKSFSREDGQLGEVIFEGVEELNRFAKNVKQQYDRLLFQYGKEGYKNIWNYEFPINELKLLKMTILGNELIDN